MTEQPKDDLPPKGHEDDDAAVEPEGDDDYPEGPQDDEATS